MKEISNKLRNQDFTITNFKAIPLKLFALSKIPFTLLFFFLCHEQFSSLELYPYIKPEYFTTNTQQLWNENDYPPLQCDAYAFKPIASTSSYFEGNQEMVYWKKVTPQDSSFLSHYQSSSFSTEAIRGGKQLFQEQFLTFEPDNAGWNNIRMGFETVVVMAMVTGRTLVLPPTQPFGTVSTKKEGSQHPELLYNFYDIYNFTHLIDQYPNLKIISMEQFLTHQGMAGKLKSPTGQHTIYPPNNRVNWDCTTSDTKSTLKDLYSYLREVALNPLNWNPNQCLAAFPEPDPKFKNHKNDNLETMMNGILHQTDGRLSPKPHHFYQRPTAVTAPPVERLRESLANRKELCIYTPEMHSQPIIHFQNDFFQDQRLLTHFYSFFFHENYHQDLFTKRLVRDGLRYNDIIACAASTIVNAIRTRARDRNPTSNPHGEFDTFHIRRNDFQSQFEETEGNITKILEHSKAKITHGSTIYIATDEIDMRFFEPMREIYDLVFLQDYIHLFPSSSTHIQEYHWGMIDQMVAARGRVFHGLFYSTFSGYVMRLRGYYSVKEKNVNDGSLKNSFYYIPRETRNEMTQYRAVRLPSFMREFPVAWRDIDSDIKESKSN